MRCSFKPFVVQTKQKKYKPIQIIFFEWYEIKISCTHADHFLSYIFSFFEVPTKQRVVQIGINEILIN